MILQDIGAELVLISNRRSKYVIEFLHNNQKYEREFANRTKMLEFVTRHFLSCSKARKVYLLGNNDANS